MSATRLKAKPQAHKPLDLAKIIEALDDFRDDPKVQGHHPDNELKSLFLHIGSRSMLWRYRRQRTKNGVRKMVLKSLATSPLSSEEEARNASPNVAGIVSHRP